MPATRKVQLQKPDGTELTTQEQDKLRRELERREAGRLPKLRVLKPLLGDAEASLIRSGEEAHYRAIRDALARKTWEARLDVLNAPGLSDEQRADLAEALASGENRLNRGDRLILPQHRTPDDVVQFVRSAIDITLPPIRGSWKDYQKLIHTQHPEITPIPDEYAAEVIRVIYGTPRGRPTEVPLRSYAQATENVMKIRHNVGLIQNDREAAAFIDLLRGLGNDTITGPTGAVPELVGRTSEGQPSGHQEALSKLEPVDAMQFRALQNPMTRLSKDFLEKEPATIPAPAGTPQGTPPTNNPKAGQYKNTTAKALHDAGYTDQKIQAAADTYTAAVATQL